MIAWEIAKLPYMKCGGARCPSRPIEKGAPYLAVHVRASRPLVRCVHCAKEFEERGPAVSPEPETPPMAGLVAVVETQGVHVGILHHPIWPDLQPFIRIEVYGRDGGPDNPRHRIEVETPPSGILLRKFLAVEMPCVVCGRTIHPIREREGRGHLYFAATCELDVNYGCARSARARDEYNAVKKAMVGYVDPSQPQLFKQEA